MKKEQKLFLETSLAELETLFPSNETLKNYRTHLFYLLSDFEITLIEFAAKLGINVSTIHRFKQSKVVDIPTLRRYSILADKMIKDKGKTDFVRKSHRIDISQN